MIVGCFRTQHSNSWISYKQRLIMKRKMDCIQNSLALIAHTRGFWSQFSHGENSGTTVPHNFPKVRQLVSKGNGHNNCILIITSAHNIKKINLCPKQKTKELEPGYLLEVILAPICTTSVSPGINILFQIICTIIPL